ncbi:MAG: DUF3179 domain-containing protein [Pseudomonadota bacterium]
MSYRRCLSGPRLLLGLLGLSLTLEVQGLNGFDLSNLEVPRRYVSQGGPPKDGIPALDAPRFVAAPDASTWLEDEAPVLGLELRGVQKAYPLSILNWHELVNDRYGSQPVLISFCPLCGTGMGFEAALDGERLVFGVSGLVYNSDLLFYDRQSESLWSQIDRRAVSGPLRGRTLTQLPLQRMTWAQWRERYPNTVVLDREQGFSRDYSDDPYAGYEQSRRLFFKVAGRIPKDYHHKEKVVGLRRGEDRLAIPYKELRALGQPSLQVRVGDETLTIRWHDAQSTVEVLDAEGTPAVHTIAFWFAWYAFHPETRIYRAQEAS